MSEPDEALRYARGQARLGNHRDWLPEAYRAGQAASAERIKALEEANEGGGLLVWLAEHPELELSWGDFGDVSECLWRVHVRHGGINDREWRLVDVGHTPTEALTNARNLLKEADQ
jgi:hypothetical protein